MKSIAIRSTILAVAAAVLPAAAEITWLTTPDEAYAKAAETGKPVMIEFTGSDWCGFCKILHKDVLSSPEFEQALADKYIFLELDFPRKKPLPENQQKVNRELAQKMGITGYPSIVMTDKDGLPYAKSVGAPLKPAEFIKSAESWDQGKIKRDEAFARARSLSGKEKAAALYDGLKTMDSSLWAPFYGEVIAEIEKSDPEDTCQFKADTARKERIISQRKEIMTIYKDNKTDLVKIEEALKTMLKREDLEPCIRQQIMIPMAIGSFRARQKEATELYKKDLDAIIAVDPASEEGQTAEKIKKELEQTGGRRVINAIPAATLQ